MEVYNPELWREFFVMAGGAAAVLAGLVFVAMSLNVSLVTKDPTHRNRAFGTLAGFVSAFLMCAFGLLGHQTHVTLGIIWLIISVVATYIYIRGIVRARQGGKSSIGLYSWRISIGAGLFLLQAIGSLILLAGSVVGIYIAASAMLLSLVFMITGAWLLFVGLSETENHKG